MFENIIVQTKSIRNTLKVAYEIKIRYLINSTVSKRKCYFIQNINKTNKYTTHTMHMCVCVEVVNVNGKSTGVTHTWGRLEFLFVKIQ